MGNLIKKCTGNSNEENETGGVDKHDEKLDNIADEEVFLDEDHVQIRNGPSYTVLRIIDGDTIEVKDIENNKIKIRMMFIDAPEMSQSWGIETKKKLQELLPVNSEVTLIGEKLDMYKRRLSVVINSDGIDVNKKLIEVGLAVYYPSGKGQEYKKCQEIAKNAGLGVWSDPTFELPSQFRKNKRNAEAN